MLSNLLGDVLVLIWKNAIHELNDGDVHAIVRKNISKLHTDGSCADDNHGIWLFLVKDLLFVRYDVAANLYTWQRTNNRAGSNDGVIKGNGLTLVVALGNLEGLSVLKRAKSVNFGNLVLLHQVADTLDDARRNLTGTLVCDTEVEAHVTGDTKGLSLMVEGVRYFSILKQCLGWDTTNVQAHTAPVLLFYYRNLLAQLCCTDGGYVATRARTDYYYVIMFISHAY